MGCKINTVLFSPAILFFSRRFAQRWKLKLIQAKANTSLNKFKGSKKPLLVVGAHFMKTTSPHFINFKRILDCHQGPQVIFFGGGGDCSRSSLSYIKERNKRIPTYAFVQDDKSLELLEQMEMKHPKVYIPFKNYSRYKPVPLGSKIWVHVGFSNKPNVRNRYAVDNMVLPLIEEFGKDVSFINPKGPTKGENFLHKKYKECFVYVKPGTDHGATTMWELGHMGRRTICPGHDDLENVVKAPPGIKEGKNIDKLIKLIKKEKERIGTVQPSIANYVSQVHIHDESWLNIKFWKNWNG
jgi:hypothetical protein